jgi:hypothetical protein
MCNNDNNDDDTVIIIIIISVTIYKQIKILYHSYAHMHTYQTRLGLSDYGYA